MPPCVGVHDRLYPSIAFSYLLFVVVTWRTLEPDGTENALAPRIWTANAFFRGGVSNCQRMEERPVSNLEKIVRINTVLARTGLSRSTLYRKIAEGTFPCQVKISVHGAGWRESAVNRWIADPIGYREEQLSQNS
jgi:prophage regulatory protein